MMFLKEPTDLKLLRQRAEALLDASSESPCELTPDEVKKLVHDLSVHQIELELQNEELLRAQQQIEKNRDELARLYHQAPVGYLTLNHNAGIEQANRTFCDMVGRPPEKVIGKPLPDLLEGVDRDIFLGRYRSFFNHPQDKTIELYIKSQGPSNGFHVRLTASKEIATDGPVDDEHRLLVIVQDISEQRIEALIRAKAESTLRNHDVFVSTLLDTIPIPIFYKDTRGRYLGCNRAYTDLTGLDAHHLIGKTVYDIAPPELAARYDDEDQKLFAAPGNQSYEWKVQAADGSMRVVVFNKATFCDSNNNVAGLVGAILDITDHRNLQECMRQAREAAEDSNRAKSEFLANMSHEIRTPMNGVIGMAELMRLTPLNEEQLGYMEMIQLSGNNLIRIISDILDFSKIEARRLELERCVFSLRAKIHEAIDIMKQQAQAKGLLLFCRIAPELPDCYWGDPDRFHQVLLNLLANAVKFTSHGSITITVLPGPPDETLQALRISIADTGIGIPRNSMYKLFTPFTQVDGSSTRKYGGTGLGLAISKQLIELMGGSISAESAEGSGSTFYISLSLEKAAQECSSTLPTTDRLPLLTHNPAACRILLVEDNTMNQRVMQTLLQKLGYATDAVSDGAEALQRLETENYDLVLMDCTMPVLDGYATTAAIRDPASKALNHQVPIVAVTARAMQGDREKCLAAGMNDYLEKPVRSRSLTAILNRWLSRG